MPIYTRAIQFSSPQTYKKQGLFKVLRFLVIQSTFSFTYLEILAVSTTSLINNPGHLSSVEQQ